MNANQVLLDKLDRMTKRELFDAMYRDTLTGALNRRAFETVVSPREMVGIADLDSLKYVNDHFGHREGDLCLKGLAIELMRKCGRDSVFRLSGDEFVIISPMPLSDLLKVQAIFPGMSFGVGRGLDQADQLLRVNKTEREAAGHRAPRGERPPWL